MFGTRLTALIAICIGVYSCNGGSEIAKSILPDSIGLQEGDIVFRRGTGITSRVVVGADIDGIYSHVGIIVNTDSGLMVAHAVPDEPDYEGDIDRVKVERTETFFSAIRAQSGAVTRYSDTVISAKAAQYALDAYLRHTLFDHNYDDDDTTKLYCCQLITLAYHNAGIELVGSGRHRVHFPGLVDTNCIFPSDLFNSPHLNTVSQFGIE